MTLDLLIILATNGHGGCEYNALSFARFIRQAHAASVVVAMPRRPETKFLFELCARNGLEAATLDCAFEADDDDTRIAMQHEALERLVLRYRPRIAFLALPWPARGTGLILALADLGVASLVKFALVPEVLHGPPPSVLPRLDRARHRRQIWFANSAHSAGLLERHFGLPQGSIEHFHVGPVGLAALVEAPEEAAPSVRDELGIGADAILAVTVGRLAGQKGYDVLVDALQALSAGDARLRFVWVGEGELRRELEARLAADGLSDRVILAGFRRDVRRILRAADLFVLPTRYEGGCSQALLEAMAEGRAIVVSDLPGVAEVARHEREALLVPPGEPGQLLAAIRRLSGDESLRARLGSAAQIRARQFSTETMFVNTFSRLERLGFGLRTNRASSNGIAQSKQSQRHRWLIDKIRSIFHR